MWRIAEQPVRGKLPRRPPVMWALPAFAAILLFSLLAGCAGPDWAKAETVTVETIEYRFTPLQLVFRHGRPYRLVLVNRGRELHEFTAPEFFQASSVRNPDALVADRHEAVVHPGERKEILFVPLRTGLYPLSCADHETFGMIGTIRVE